MRHTAALLALFLLAGSADRRASERTADDVWRQAVAARGGAAALHGFRNFVIEESTPVERLREYAGDRKIDVIVCEPPGKWWEFLDYRPGKMGFDTHVVNVEQGLEWFSSGGPARTAVRSGAGDTRYRMIQYQYVYFLETGSVRPAPTQLKELAGFDVVQTDVQGERVDFYLDRKSHLPIHVETVRTLAPRPGARWSKPATRTYRYTLDKYETVNGIQVPTRVALGGDTAVSRVEVNLDLDPRLFETPPDNVTRADEWRRYLRRPAAR